MALVVASLVLFLIFTYWGPLSSLINLDKKLWILFIFSKNQLLVLVIFFRLYFQSLFHLFLLWSLFLPFYFGFCFSNYFGCKVVYWRFFLFSEASVTISFPLRTAFVVSHTFLFHYVFVCLHVFISSLSFFSDLLVV